ncbi:hypothetical protein [Flavobacterium humi]|uniref:Uncharacterized protein n=1 Tax=Flavobacterium humi TaxID=2562683 RepID=A0A4Z0L8H8_9FLAO|nr:hypothetical protein [Flavobacterium humi]TGD58734.1 hypothetical protein E4635_07410 [Flavobacterium humi]
MKKVNLKLAKDLSDFLEFEVSNLRVIKGGDDNGFSDNTGDTGDTGGGTGTGGGPIDPPIHRPQLPK